MKPVHSGCQSILARLYGALPLKTVTAGVEQYAGPHIS